MAHLPAHRADAVGRGHPHRDPPRGHRSAGDHPTLHRHARPRGRDRRGPAAERCRFGDRCHRPGLRERPPPRGRRGRAPGHPGQRLRAERRPDHRAGGRRSPDCQARVPGGGSHGAGQQPGLPGDPRQRRSPGRADVRRLVRDRRRRRRPAAPARRGPRRPGQGGARAPARRALPPGPGGTARRLAGHAHGAQRAHPRDHRRDAHGRSRGRGARGDRPRPPPPQRRHGAARGTRSRARGHHVGHGRVGAALHGRRPRPGRAAGETGSGVAGQRRAPQPDARRCRGAAACRPARRPRRVVGVGAGAPLQPRGPHRGRRRLLRRRRAGRRPPGDVHRRRHGPRRRRRRSHGAGPRRGPGVRRAGSAPGTGPEPARRDVRALRLRAARDAPLPRRRPAHRHRDDRERRSPAAGPAAVGRLCPPARVRRRSAPRCRCPDPHRGARLLRSRRRPHRLHRRAHRAPG